MTDYKALKGQSKKLSKITPLTIMKLREELGLSETTTLQDCRKIYRELTPLTKYQKEILASFESDWNYIHEDSLYYTTVLELTEKGYLTSNLAKNKFKLNPYI